MAEPTRIGSQLRSLRKARGWTQSDLAEKAGMKRTALGAYEEGRAEPKLETLLKIADHFKLKVDDLIRSELTVNKIAHFEYPLQQTKDMKTLFKKLDEMYDRIKNIEHQLKK